jgi:hypothetical protein
MKAKAVKEAPVKEEFKITIPERVIHLDRYSLGKTEIKFVGVENQGLHELYVRTAMEHLVTIRETIKKLDRYTRSLPGITSSRCRLAMHALILGNPAYMEAAARLYAFEQRQHAGAAACSHAREEPLELNESTNAHLQGASGLPPGAYAAQVKDVEVTKRGTMKVKRKYIKRDAKYWQKIGKKAHKRFARKAKRKAKR